MASVQKLSVGCTRCLTVSRIALKSHLVHPAQCVTSLNQSHWRSISTTAPKSVSRYRNNLPPPPLLTPDLEPPRGGDTYMVERLWQLPPGPDGGRPTREQMNELYKLLKVTDMITYPKDMQCILTDFVDGIGIRGDVVTVNRNTFHEELYPAGLAVYASPDNIEEFEEERKAKGIEKEGSRLGVFARMTMKELNQLVLEIPMQDKVEWTLTKKHVQVAFRLQGIELEEDSLTLPEEPVNEFGEISIGVLINEMEAVTVKADILPVLEKFPPSKK